MSKGTLAEAEIVLSKLADGLDQYRTYLLVDLAAVGVPIKLLNQAVSAGFTPAQLVKLLYRWGPQFVNGLKLELVRRQNNAVAELCEPLIV